MLLLLLLVPTCWPALPPVPSPPPPWSRCLGVGALSGSSMGGPTRDVAMHRAGPSRPGLL